MSLPRRLFHMIRRMTRYGLILGGLAGLLVTLTLLPFMERPTFYGMPVATSSIVFWGTVLGVLYGTVTGFTCGVGMALFTVLLFRTMVSVPLFRWFMGSTAFMLAVATFVGRGLWDFGGDFVDPTTWNATMIMSVVIAIYASQRVASSYLRETFPRKQKNRVA